MGDGKWEMGASIDAVGHGFYALITVRVASILERGWLAQGGNGRSWRPDAKPLSHTTPSVDCGAVDSSRADCARRAPDARRA